MITNTSFPPRDVRTDLTENRLEKPLDRGERETLENCERVIQGGLDTFIEVGGALSVIRDQRLYRASHKTFEDYCREKWDMTGRRARQLCAAAGVVRNLLEERTGGTESKVQSPMSKVDGETDAAEPDLFPNAPQIVTKRTIMPSMHASEPKPELPKPTSERQVRPLTQLPREEQRPAYREAVQAAGGKAPTHEQVAAAVEKRSPKSKEQSPESGLWPVPNSSGVYPETDALKRVCRGLPKNCSAMIRALQIAPEKWISAYEYQHGTGGVSGPLTKRVTYRNPSAAVLGAAEELLDSIKNRLYSAHTTAATACLVKIRSWAEDQMDLEENNEVSPPQNPPGESRVEKILAEAERTVIQIRRFQDLVDTTDRPVQDRCNRCVQLFEEIEVKFKRKRNQEVKPAKKPKVTMAARTLMQARAKARWAAAKAGGNGTKGTNGTDGKARGGELLVIRRKGTIFSTGGNKDGYLTAHGGWTVSPKQAQKFKSRAQAEAVLRGQDGQIIPFAGALNCLL